MKWKTKIENTIGTNKWEALTADDQHFLVKASRMFDLGKKVDIKKILERLAQ